MPLFFFLSGYVTYQPIKKQSFVDLRKQIKKKILGLMIPTVVIISVAAYIHTNTIERVLFDPMKIGYWFTFVLFQIFILYYFVKFVTDKYLSNTGETGIFLFIILISYILSNFRFYLDISWIKILSFSQVISYTQFFFIGLLAKKYQNKFVKLCTKQALITFLFMVFVILFYLNGDKEFLFYKVTYYILVYCTLFLVFILFYNYQSFFSSYTPIGKGLIYIGQHTLEIYFLHYFFLFKLPELALYFNDCPENCVLMILTTVVLSVIIIVFCLLTMKIINIVKPVSFLLFGPAKKIKK
ncbi:acyltransferase/acetyltransferase [Bacteroidia bacterium]|nr:acyltransferase/acetyltransferase [Bacteroidia bacterium]